MIEQYARIYVLYRSALIRTVRLLILFFVLVLLYSDFAAGLFPKFPLFLLLWFFMIEVFFHFKIARITPTATVASIKDTNGKDAYTFPVLVAYASSNSMKDFLHHLAKLPQVSLLLEKAGISPQELSVPSEKDEQLGAYAVELVKKMKGKYVTSMDMMASHLLQTEEKTKLLFNKKIKSEEFLQLLFWVRFHHKSEERPETPHVHVFGGGFGEALTTGWTPETEKYTDDFTFRALRTTPLPTGREETFNTMLRSLVRAKNNNVMLIGEVGSGKENLVALLAKMSFSDELGGALNNKVVYEVMLGPLIAGTSDRGLLEERLQAIIAEVAHSGNVILYIPEFQNILGSSSYNIDLSGAILPYLKEGYIPIIATMTPGNYKTYLERNPLKEVFEVIRLPEPTENTALQMVLESTQSIEKRYRVIIPFVAVKKSVQIAGRYLSDDALPGSAVALLEDVANTVSLTKRPYFPGTRKKLVTEDDVAKKIEEKAHVAVSEPTGEEKEILLHLEEKLHQRVIDQEAAINVIAQAMRRLRTGLTKTTKPISFLFLGPTGVGKTETAKALAEIYFGGESNMIRLDMSEYTDESGVKRLLGAPPGEGEERGELTDRVHDDPTSLILLDEFEKAHPKIRDLFLQVFDDGRLTDNKGRTVSFINTIIIATSNAGSEFIREQVQKGVAVDKAFHQKLLDSLQQQGVFKPELLNRFDDIVIFTPLGQKEVEQITRLILKGIVKTLDAEDISVTFDEAVIAKIAKEGYDPQFGARPIRRYIQDTVEDVIAQKKLRDEVKRGSKITITVDQMGNIICTTAGE